MVTLRKNSFFPWITAGVLFLSHFVYFLRFNCYHLIYQEQTQLFRFDGNYFSSFLSKPGGLCTYLGTFFIQFYQSPFTAAFIVTLFAIALAFITVYILHQLKINGIIWSVIPVIFLAALQSHHLYLLGNTIGLLVSLGFFAFYISISKDNYRYLTGILGCSFLYFISGGFSIFVFALCIIHELVFSTNRNRFFTALGFAVLAFLIPFLSSKVVYYVKTDEIWLSLMPFHLKKSLYPFVFALLLYFPLLLPASKCWCVSTKKDGLQSGWNWKTILAGIVVVGGLSFCVVRFVYDPKTEILLRIDHYVQKGEWKKALESSFRYPGNNQLVLYYGNLAMYKTGQMSDKMFHLPQIGVHGLWLEWKRNEIAPFFGGEVFYHLGYISEAYRWAFEAMEAKGQNPRCLKRLVVTSIITRDTAIAQQYINVLKETLFYRKWAQHYQNLINNSELLIHDLEIMEKRHYEVHTDFFADRNNNDIGLIQLLENHPDNRMAFEYYMAWLLLNKNLDAFAANIYRLKELGYTYIPVHYEEAMLVYMNYTKKNIVPDGYSIKQETLRRLSDYFNTFSSSRDDRNFAARSLFRMYGGTYWFYLNFVDISNQNSTANTTKK